MLKKDKSNLKNKIILHIYDALLCEKYKTKEQIKEVLLAQELNVSRAPIREALTQLVGEGILEQIPKRGVFVKEITIKDIYDTYEAKGLIEGYLARSFAINASKKDMNLLDKYVLDMSKKTNLKNDVAKIGTKFHKFYLKYCKNDVLFESLDKLNKKSHLLFSKNWPKLYTLEEIKTRHEKIVKVLKTRVQDDIENVIREHYLETGSKIVLLQVKNNYEL